MDTGRDQGLRRLSRITRWVVGGTVLLAGLFSAVVAHSRPGHSTTSASPSSSPASPASTGDNFFQSPGQAPVRSSGRGLVTSGAT